MMMMMKMQLITTAPLSSSSSSLSSKNHVPTAWDQLYKSYLSIQWIEGNNLYEVTYLQVSRSSLFISNQVFCGFPFSLLVIAGISSLLFTAASSGLQYTWSNYLKLFFIFNWCHPWLYLISSYLIPSSLILKLMDPGPHLDNTYLIDMLYFYYPILRTIKTTDYYVQI